MSPWKLPQAATAGGRAAARVQLPPTRVSRVGKAQHTGADGHSNNLPGICLSWGRTPGLTHRAEAPSCSVSTLDLLDPKTYGRNRKGRDRLQDLRPHLSCTPTEAQQKGPCRVAIKALLGPQQPTALTRTPHSVIITGTLACPKACAAFAGGRLTGPTSPTSLPYSMGTPRHCPEGLNQPWGRPRHRCRVQSLHRPETMSIEAHEWALETCT